MELLKGRSLADLLEGTRLELPRALHIAHQICRALHAAHERDIVHRDLKPENVFVARKGDFDFVKVLDFGISKVKTAETEQVRMTKTGQLVGTPLYMSPEQAKGEQDVDRRTDIYALGVMLYEMLTGTPPFEGGNYFQLLWKHGNETPDPLRLRNPALPPRLEEVVMRALEKDPAARFQTMAEMEAALAEAVPEVAPPPGHFHSSMPSLPSMAGIPRADVAPKRSFGGWIAGIVLATVGAMLAIVWAMGEGEEPAETTDPDGVSGVVMAPSEAAGGEEGETAAPAVEEEEMPSGAETPTTVSISFDSRPPGATVTVGGEEIGTTPFVAPLPESADPIEVTFSLPRYADAVENLIPSEGASVTARLRSLRRGEPRTGAGTGMAWMDEL
jgi:serine/threonine-protein kinase